MNHRRPNGQISPMDEEGRDLELAAALEAVDPASSEPAYWLRFQMGVLRNAAAELARRRLMADLTMTDVLAGWARAVVPTAVAAAVIAGAVLLRPSGTHDELAGAASVEEVLVQGIEDETIPVTLVNDDAGVESVALAAERF